MEITTLLDSIFSQSQLDTKWYPYILIGMGLIGLVIVAIIFSFIRTFLSWFFGVNEVIRLGREHKALLIEILEVQEQQLALMEALFIENSDDASEESTLSDDPDVQDDTDFLGTAPSEEIHEIISSQDENFTSKK